MSNIALSKLSTSYDADLVKSAIQKSREKEVYEAVDLVSVYQIVFDMKDDPGLNKQRWREILGDVSYRLKVFVEDGFIPEREKPVRGMLDLFSK